MTARKGSRRCGRHHPEGHHHSGAGIGWLPCAGAGPGGQDIPAQTAGWMSKIDPWLERRAAIQMAAEITALWRYLCAEIERTERLERAR
jgi:hypothetical protein